MVRSLVQSRSDGRLIDAEPKSRAGRRMVSFPRRHGPVGGHLDRFVAPQRKPRLRRPRQGGGRLRRQNFRGIWIAACDEAGLSVARLHDLRYDGQHDGGGDGRGALRELMERMGHASPRAAPILSPACDQGAG